MGLERLKKSVTSGLSATTERSENGAKVDVLALFLYQIHKSEDRKQNVSARKQEPKHYTEPNLWVTWDII